MLLAERANNTVAPTATWRTGNYNCQGGGMHRRAQYESNAPPETYQTRKRPAHAKPVPRLRQTCASTDQLLYGLLDWLDAISVDIERYVWSGNSQNAVLVEEQATNEDALAWISTRLEDIGATLVGISLPQTPRKR